MVKAIIIQQERFKGDKGISKIINKKLYGNGRNNKKKY